MIRSRPLRSGLAALTALGLLTGCITLLPKSKPAQLYRFGAEPVADAAGRPSAPPAFTVRTGPIKFDQAAEGVNILTVDGRQTAYIAHARWITPASDMFAEALARRFAAQPAGARLMSRGETQAADYVLRLDVSRFEARYLSGTQQAPTAVVEVRAVLSKGDTPGVTLQKTFHAELAASDNRVGPITTAIDGAVGKVLGELVAWVGGRGA